MQISPELVEACRRGDAEAFEALVRETHRVVYSVALRITGNTEDAADVTQEVYVRVWRAIRSFRGDSNLATWMHRVTTNAALTHLRRRGRLAEPSEEDGVMDRIASPGDEDARIDAAEIDAALARLPDSYRVPVVMKDVYGMNCEEIGRHIGLTEGAVKVRLFRARRRLAEDLVHGGVVVPMKRRKVKA